MKMLCRALAACLLLSAAPALAAEETQRVSRFGEYKGYSQPVYDGWERTSFHIPARDGTRLAMDLFRPTLGGKTATERLPVLWTANCYQRAAVFEGKRSGFGVESRTGAVSRRPRESLLPAAFAVVPVPQSQP